MKRFTSILKQKNPFDSRSNSGSSELPAPEGDNPEANAARSIKLFCEAGGPSAEGQGEEVLHLPVIVDACESSPAAAGLAAQHIRKYLSMSNSSRPHTQYNSVMLIRILADNPGATFTRNFDSKFIATMKDVLRHCKDPSVQQILRETLMSLYRDKAYDTNLSNLFAMWQKESGMSRPPGGSGDRSNGSSTVQGPGGFALPGPPPGYPPRPGKALPAPPELAARIEEARTSAKLLQQLVQSTPQAELKNNDLIKEFAERCQSAQRSVQGYISAENPAPDDDTMQTLIETTEQLSLALSKHSRALLQARRAQSSTPTPTPPPTNNSAFAPPSGPPPGFVPSAGLGISDHPIPNSNLAYDTSMPITHPAESYSPPPLPPPSLARREVAAAPDHSYSPPPLPPPSHNAQTTATGFSRPPVPVGLPDQHDDPFADAHEEGGDTTAPLPDTGLPHSGRPGYNNVTPSYVRRQDSAEEHLTMHGGSPPVSPERSRVNVADGRNRTPVSPVYPEDPKR
ncbi:hypothetical protein BT63DRAFT_117362 [Microthyrium microscopicum]|uniref:GAT domain-containing protein n=1 Tax=Microthyrium microscopicum TaxID=703497 RepID=A0A6A6TX23_9PEZI|nr:hypothetical protein BT63DRAFT_117362 [Microthyrium microscopicum]